MSGCHPRKEAEIACMDKSTLVIYEFLGRPMADPRGMGALLIL